MTPFGGSGTTGLACQFLGVHPVLAEVNPYLADVTEAKLTSYVSIEQLIDDLDIITDAVTCDSSSCVSSRYEFAPRTFIEPGHKGRWIFDSLVGDRISALLDLIENLDEAPRRLFRVILGGVLVEVSNIRVSGKGRRYRQGWKNRAISPGQVTELFLRSARRAIEDISKFSCRSVTSYEMLRGDSRDILHDIDACQLAVFSPPYPNSFDYTDIYNVELWALGYLDAPDATQELRSATLTSHVQVSRDFSNAPAGSPTLSDAITRLYSQKCQLWDHRIPDMVGAYFSDLMMVLDQLSHILVKGGSAWIVVGDSRYAGVQIPVATVLAELARERGWIVLKREFLRAMRTSFQQGGGNWLSEQMLVIQKEP